MRIKKSKAPRVVASALALLYCACSSTTRFEVLSFFFDGVPDPNRKEVFGPKVPPVRLGPLTDEEKAAYRARLFKPVFRTTHEPWQQKRCESCHELMPEKKQNGWMQGLPKLLAPMDELCLKCHVIPDKKFVHGPTASGDCALCHVPHQSSFPHLLRWKTPTAACARCHIPAELTTAKLHATFGDKDCTECHDPHTSELRYMKRVEGMDPSDYAPHTKDWHREGR